MQGFLVLKLSSCYVTIISLSYKLFFLFVFHLLHYKEKIAFEELRFASVVQSYLFLFTAHLVFMPVCYHFLCHDHILNVTHHTESKWH